MPLKGSPDRLPWLQAALARFEGPLLRYAVKLTGDLEKAREVVQDAFLRLWEADPAEIDDHLAPWLYTVCRNRALDVRKKEKRMKPFSRAEEVESVPSTEVGASGRYEQAETKHGVIRAIQGLPPNQREVIRLKFQNDLSYKEIAEVTGLSVSNVGFLIHTAIQEIKKTVSKQEGTSFRSGGVR